MAEIVSSDRGGVRASCAPVSTLQQRSKAVLSGTANVGLEALEPAWLSEFGLPARVEGRNPVPALKSAVNRMGTAAAFCHDPVIVTVLIVDDHPSFRASARMLLEAEGFDVVGEAEDGLSAIAAAHDLRPEVVLLDVQLPDIDGFEVASRLTAERDAPAIVLVSSRDGSDFGPLVAESGACGFIAKAELSGERISALLG
jgi:CheY-like chemotaxis protein